VTVLAQLLNGLQLGSVYALIALGYTMVYGIILLLNFAHGDIIMVGAYISWIALAQLGLHPIVAAILAVVGCTLLGVLIDKVAYAPLRNAPRLSILITAIGVSYFLENGAQLVFGADAKVVPAFTDITTIQVGGVTLYFTAILTIVVTAISTIVLNLLVQKTKLGKAMRAVSEDMGAARLMGINVNNTISFTFAVGSALAGIGAVLYSMAYTQATPTMGIMLGTKAFVAAVLGGIGSIPGAVIGGLLVGMAEVLVSALGFPVWKDAVVYLLLIVVLIFRPTGILGRTMNEKV
jgi:branched-chain amino acid transport system permease protein